MRRESQVYHYKPLLVVWPLVCVKAFISRSFVTFWRVGGNAVWPVGASSFASSQHYSFSFYPSWKSACSAKKSNHPSPGVILVPKCSLIIIEAIIVSLPHKKAKWFTDTSVNLFHQAKETHCGLSFLLFNKKDTGYFVFFLSVCQPQTKLHGAISCLFVGFSFLRKNARDPYPKVIYSYFKYTILEM